MSESIVIDTNVITYAAGGHGDSSQTAACAEIVFSLISNDELALAFDTDEHILEEYKNNLEAYKTPHVKVIQEYLQRELRGGSNGISYHIPIDESEVEELEEMGFHDDDLMFVRVAPRTDKETITSCDKQSFLKEEYKEWIQQELEVKVVTPEDFDSEVE